MSNTPRMMVGTAVLVGAMTFGCAIGAALAQWWLMRMLGELGEAVGVV